MKMEIQDLIDSDCSYNCYSILLFLFCLGFFLLHYLPYHKNKSAAAAKKNEAKYVYPPCTPFTRLEELRLMFAEDPTNFLVELASHGEKVWRYRRLRPFAPMMFEVFDADIQRQVLNDKSATKAQEIYGLYYKIHGGNYNIFCSNGSKWYHARKAIAPAFSSQHVRRMNAVAAGQIDKWIEEKMLRYVDEKEPIDITSEMLKLTLSVIVEAAFEYKITEQQAEFFLEELHLALLEAAYSMIPHRKYIAWMLSSTRRADIASKRIMAFCKTIMESYKSLESPLKGTVMDCIMNNPSYENEDEKLADMFVMLVGGHDTTAYTISWTLFELAKHPNHQVSLRSRLKEDATSSSPPSSSGNHHSHDRAEEELHHIIKESMRLHPVAAWGTCRKIASDLVIKRRGRDNKNNNNKACSPDYVIPKGSIVNCSIMPLSRNETYFQNPHSFIPSRWINPTQQEKESFMPFLIGKRNCLGQSLAHSTLRTVISKLCMDYNFTIYEEGTARCFFTLAPKGMKLLVTKA